MCCVPSISLHSEGLQLLATRIDAGLSTKWPNAESQWCSQWTNQLELHKMVQLSEKKAVGGASQSSGPNPESDFPCVRSRWAPTREPSMPEKNVPRFEWHEAWPAGVAGRRGQKKSRMTWIVAPIRKSTQSEAVPQDKELSAGQS